MQKRIWTGYAFAVIAVAAAALLRLALWAVLGDRLPFITFFPAVIVVALSFGIGPGLLATALSAATAMFLVPPIGTLHITSTIDQVGLALYTLINTWLVWVADRARQSNSRAEFAAAAHARLAAIVESSDDAIVSKSPEGVIQTWNRGAEQIFGYTTEEVVGQPILMLIPPDRQHEEPKILAQIRRGERIDHFETIRRRKDGKLIEVSVTVSPVRDFDGRIIGVSKIARDISRQKQFERDMLAAKGQAESAEAATRVAADQLTLAMASAGLGDWSWDAGSDLVNCSERAAAIFGIPAGPHLTWARMRDMLVEDDRENARLAVEQALAGRSDYDITYRVIRSDGQQVRIHAMGRGQYDAKENVTGMIGVVQDVTSQQQVTAERERLLASERDAREEAETLHRVGRSLAGELDLHKLVQVSTDAATEICGAQFGSFFYNVIDADGESYMLFTISGVPREAFGKFPMPRNTDVFSATFRGEGIVRLDDVTQDPRYGKNPPYNGMPAGHLPVRSYLAAPVISRSGEVLGGLFFGHEAVGRFSPRHERIVAGIAGQAALAIDNARLYEAVRAGGVESQKNLAQLQAVIGSMHEGLILFDAQGTMFQWNRAALEMHGFQSMDEVQTSFAELSPKFEILDLNGQPLAKDDWPLSRVLRGEAFQDSELLVRRLDSGAEHEISYSGRAVRDEAGGVSLGILTLRNVTRQRAEQRRQSLLVELNDTLRSVSDPQEIMWAAITTIGRQLNVTRCTYGEIDEAQEHVIVQRDFTQGVGSVVGKHVLNHFGEEVIRQLKSGQCVAIDNVDVDPRTAGPPAHAYAAIQTRSLICVPLVKADRFVALLVVQHAQPRRWKPDEVRLLEEVAERTWAAVESAQFEKALRESEERLRLGLEAGETGTWDWDIKTNRVQWSDRVYEFHGMTPETWGGRVEDFQKLIHPDDQQRVKDSIEAAIAAGSSYEIEFRVQHPSGEVRWLTTTGRVFRDANGDPARMMGATRDVTQRAQMQQERERLLESERHARTEAERASRLKDEFLATLGHELRTPLNAILGWSQILKTGGSQPHDVAEGLAVIERNARAQTQIIEDLLDMSRIISGKIRLDVQRVDLVDIVRAAVETVTPTAESKGIRLQTVLDPMTGPVSGDPNRLQQVFWNLLTNAIKFTPKEGRVQVLLERINSHLEISIVDTGEGISADFLPHVFDRFRQADGSTTRRHGGLGLGLAIVRSLVELHGGNVRVKSGGAGMGSTFVVTLPLAVLHPEPEDHVTRRHPKAATQAPVLPDFGKRLAGVEVVVVDDEPDARELVKRLLEDCDAVVTIAATAAEALDHIRSNRPDVLVSDIGMPGEDGYSLIRKVRALAPGDGGNLPAIALTAYARAEDRMRSILAGYQMHIAKPVEPAELITMVASLAGRTPNP